ncbi:MAG: 3-phosphoshikimate 1-carboxyvinyltransferase [Deltaproteobacteria bacterium]|nr:3-phosphoshikimate 1-carboxyvinyltransferase [Deltaproteobacteria bacterium]
MNLLVKESALKGSIEIPASKSHTIRAVVIASLAQGQSRIVSPLDSGDTRSVVVACRALGAEIETGEDWVVRGFGGNPKLQESKIDVGNSGTSLRLTTSVAALQEEEIIFDGDASLRSRPLQPLLDALNNLGARAYSLENNGCCPISVKGRMKGGETEVSGVTSQYLSSLLISTPLLEEDTEISVIDLHEKPYVEMTLTWLNEQQINYEREGWEIFRVRGRQSYHQFDKRVPGDFSSATFPLCAAVITPSHLMLKGLDMNDTQGDKEVITMLKKMGAGIQIKKEGVLVDSSELVGCELDLNNTPDALPALAVVGCYAKGETILKNVAQARIKETDRIKVMATELSKMGAEIEEMEDGLIIRQSELQGTRVSGYHDHRVVMALSLAGMIAQGETEIDSAESVDITFPGYVEKMCRLGARMEIVP